MTATPDVNIRNSPVSGGILGKWQTGRIGIVKDCATSGWYETKWSGDTAYVSKSYIKDNGAAAASIPTRMKVIADHEVGLAEPDAYTYYNTSTAWCQVFVNWLAYQAGMPQGKVPNTASTPKGIEWHILNGNRFWFVNATHKAKMRQYSTSVSSNTVSGLTAAEQSFVPQPGDFIYFVWTNSGDHCSHVGFVYSVNTSTNKLVTVEGNISNAVVKRTWNLSDSEIVGYGRLQF